MTFVTENMRPMLEDTTNDTDTGFDIWIAKENHIISYRLFETRIAPCYLLPIMQTFDAKQNRWEQTTLDIVNAIPGWFGSTDVSWYTYNPRERVLYVQYIEGGVLKIKLDQKTVEHIMRRADSELMVSTRENISSFSVDDTYFHGMLDEEPDKLQEILIHQKDFAAENQTDHFMFTRNAMVYLSRRNKLIFFGSADTNSSQYLVYQYSLETRKWSFLLEAQALETEHYLNCLFTGNVKLVATEDEENIIIFHLENEAVHVYDVRKNEMKKCSLKLPAFERSAGAFGCVMLKDRTKEELVTFGYIRSLFPRANSKSMHVLPTHIGELVSRWVVFEFVHIVWPRRKHFRISVNDIFKSIV